jgi:hypothetical protein
VDCNQSKRFNYKERKKIETLSKGGKLGGVAGKGQN